MANGISTPSYILIPSDQAEWVVSQMAELLERSSTSGALTVIVRQLPEGVFLGTSEELPGLIVEANTRDDVIDAALAMTAELLELDGRSADRRVTFFFDH